jgi:hypothetical protein
LIEISPGHAQPTLTRASIVSRGKKGAAVMTPIGISVIILLTVLAGTVLGIVVGRRLPEHHLSSETKTVISASMAVVGTISALMLGLLISDSSRAFSARNDEIAKVSADFILLDRLLRRYGPEAAAARYDLRRYAKAKLYSLFPAEAKPTPTSRGEARTQSLEHVQDMILAFKPSDDRQRWLKDRAVQLMVDVGDTRWFLLQRPTNSIPVPVLVLVVFWQTILFASFGLFAPKNLTATIALILCVIAASSGIAMVLEMEMDSFTGLIRLSSAPIHYALKVIGQ